ncbi:MAG: transcriptional regulator [Methylotenera sp.]|nr:MAG: transcriptional regulator [Methylotenera sp.]
MSKIEDQELAQFCEDLLTSAKQMKAGNTRVALSPIANIRNKINLSQSKFADLLGVSVRTLQDWEQGRAKPSGAAKTLLKIAELNPDALMAVA